MGGLVFARYGLLPALAEVDESTRDRIHDAIRRRWLPWVIGAITVLLASGLANFLIFNGRVKAEGWADGEWMRQTSYHALFGAKFLLAMVVFYFASGLVGRGEGTQWVRNDRAKWLSVTLGLALAIVLLSGWMRQLHTGPNLPLVERWLCHRGDRDRTGIAFPGRRAELTSMDKKEKKRIEVLQQKIAKLQQQLAGAKKQPDDPAEIPRLEKELAAAHAELTCA
jgi:uncharacterized membrane protein